MLELTAANVLDFLRSKQWIEPGPAQAEPLGWGVSNAVLRVKTPEKILVLKQSRPQLRTRDPWFSDLNRVFREQEVMEVLFPLLPPLTVPQVLFSDREHFVFAMSHAPLGAQVWKESLLAGKINVSLGQQIGRVLGLIHEETSRDSTLRDRFGNRAVFHQLRVEPFYHRIIERRPEVAAPVHRIMMRMAETSEALCHGDYSPKNILTHEHGFTLVDYETAHWGDPTMDLGFMLSHLFLKAVKRHPEDNLFFELIAKFWQGYGEVVRYRPIPELQARAIEHFAICALARIDGTSPVDYLSEATKRETVRNLCRQILNERPANWGEVVALVKANVQE
jgi:5-methylthioribose kinase